MTEETTPSAPALTAEQQAATEQLERIYADRAHAFNAPGHPRYDAAAAEVLGLRRLLLGADNRPAVEYREAAADQGPPPRLENVPISTSYTRDDFLQAVPGDWGIPEARREADAIDAIGATPFEGLQLVNQTLGSAPPPEDELDLDALWGEARDVNVRLVTRLLTALRAQDDDLHARLLPYIQRRAAVANHVLAVAQRLAQGGAR
jgi:hypothetical protein